MHSIGSVQHTGSRLFVAQNISSSRRSGRTNTPAIRAKKGEDETPDNIFSKFIPKPSTATGGTLSFFSGASKNGSAKDGNEGTQSFFAGFGTVPQKSTSTNTVFVAGSTGRLGIRVVYELLAAGFTVRAGVRSQEKADGFKDQLNDLAQTLGPLTLQQEGRVKVVYCDLTDPSTIAPAIGNASKIVCAVGAAETEFKDISAPKRIDFEGTENLISIAASLNSISQFILVTSLGTGKLGFPAGLLNIFGGVLIWKRKAEEALEASGMPYLIVRPGGMERPKDDHKLTHNVRLNSRDTLFGGTVSRLQIAELIAAAVANPEVAENKAVEVVAETKAPSVDYTALLAAERTEIIQSSREERLEVVKEIREDLEEAKAQVESSRARLASVREIVADLQLRTSQARSAAKEAQKEQGDAIKSAEEAESEVERLRAAAEEAGMEAQAAKAVAAEAQRAARESRILSRQEIAEIRKGVLSPEVNEQQEAVNLKSSSISPVPGFFGTILKQARPTAAAVVEEEEVVVVKSKPALPSFFGGGGFFGAKQQEASVEEEEEVEEEEKEEEEEEQQVLIPEKAAGGGGFFGGISSFFQPQGTVYIDEVEINEIKAEKPSGAAAMKAAREARSAAKQVEEKELSDQAEPTPSEPTPSESTPSDPGKSLSLPSIKLEMPSFQIPSFGGFGQQQVTTSVIDAMTQEKEEDDVAAKARADAEARVVKAKEEARAREAAEIAATKAAEEDVAKQKKEGEAIGLQTSSYVPDNVQSARAWIEAWRSNNTVA